jgi:hypothetical protein
MDPDCTQWPYNPHAAPNPKGDPMQFPANRLREAGATDEEINQLAAEHDQQPDAEKLNLLRRLEEIAKGDIVAWLEQLRESGHFGETTEAEPAPADLGDLTRAELHEIADAHGVEDPHKLPNKQAVIEAIKDAKEDAEQDALATLSPEELAAHEAADAADRGEAQEQPEAPAAD